MDYKAKYLKYKQKYLTLQSDLKGGECNPEPNAGDEDMISFEELINLQPNQRITVNGDCFDLNAIYQWVIIQNKNVDPKRRPIDRATKERINNAYLQLQPVQPGQALIEAVTNGNLEQVIVLLQQPGIPAQSLGDALVDASGNGHLLIVERLLQQQPRIPARSLEDALFNASENGHLVIVERLLQQPEMPAWNLGSALRSASENGHLVIVERLLQRPEIPARFLGYALKGASENGYLVIVERLLQKPELPAMFLGYALKDASQNGHLVIVERLLQQRGIPADSLIRAKDITNNQEIKNIIQNYIDEN